jgi:glycine betaine/proline transport system substrate-binding protein
MKKLGGILLVSLLCLGLIAGCAQGATGDTQKQTVRLGYVNWAEGIAMTNLAAVILEDKMGYEVEMTMADVAPLFTSLASGNTDAFLDSWLPVTHQSYWEEYGDKLEDLGVNFENARIGLVVPAYVDIDSIEDLNGAKNDFDGKIIGIDSGAGIMKTTDKAIEEYGLDYELVAGSDPTMAAALKKAIDSSDPIVVTGWSPHWMFAKWDLKFLDDPKGTYGSAEEIHTLARKGLSEDMPDVAAFLKNFRMDDSTLGDLMGDIEENSDQDAKEVARAWMNENEALINGWIPAQ